jgi:hypothetical protein
MFHVYGKIILRVNLRNYQMHVMILVCSGQATETTVQCVLRRHINMKVQETCRVLSVLAQKQRDWLP